ncbi:hypothetical protein MNO14_16585 [Luteimonas sp. S4-F44]|uniref:hypothetical protein n=1 Tax=Luteimonas sp. S4-F44 TaxID=2925842 RepID=UPI001F52BFE3|nr:hypothetical protein [Luteimonas sp. S4-F44]UNK42520.1 hypothetical protein MNO14_16585 [Luteimonas sp. S4-F44]
MSRFLCPLLTAALLFVSSLSSVAQDGSGTRKRPSPEDWGAQQRASATPLPEDDGALVAANSKALGEACGFSAAELSKLTSNNPRRGPAFEAAVESHMPGARRRASEQRRAPEFQQNCEFMRFRLGNGN